MPELPEVETMARDLAPLVEGATIEGAWWDWDKVVRYPDRDTFLREIRGRQVERGGRRAKWLVLDSAPGRDEVLGGHRGDARRQHRTPARDERSGLVAFVAKGHPVQRLAGVATLEREPVGA